MQQLRPSVNTVHNRVKVAVVVIVAHGKAPGRRSSRNTAAANETHVLKLAVAQVAIEILALCVGGVNLCSVYLGINMAVGNQNVEPAIVIDVHEAHTPAHQSGIDSKPGLVCPIIEGAVPEILIQGVGITCEVGLGNVQ